MTFSSLFHASRLAVHIPPPSLGPPPEDPTAESAQRWARDLLATSSRHQAFYDEDLRSYLSVKLPAPPPAADDAPSPQPSTEIISFVRHLQVTIEASYVSPLSAEGSPAASSTATFSQQSGHYPFPPTPAGVPSTPRRASGVPAHLARRVSGGPPLPISAPTPTTPLPTPSVGTNEERRYIRSEGISVYSSIWQPASPKDGVYLAWSEEEGVWVAVWSLAVPVAFVRTKIQDPLLCLTASITLREQETVATVKGYESVVAPPPSSLEASPTLHELEEEIVNPSSVGGGNLLQGLAKASFPAARIHGPQPSISSHPALSLGHSQGPKVVPPTTLLSLPTLRKSFRTVLELASGLSLKMRTVYLPHLVIPPNRVSHDGEESEEDEEEERKVVVSVDVESTGGPGLGFAVDRIDFKIGGVGGSSARVELLGGEGKTFPLELEDGDQYSLLYIVSFDSSAATASTSAAQQHLPSASTAAFQPHNWSTSLGQPLLATTSSHNAAALPSSHRPVSIAVHGHPFVDTPPDFLTPGFVSKWNCTLDLSHLTEAAEEKLDLPSMAGVPSALGDGAAASTGVKGGASVRPPSVIAGNKRFSLANVSSHSHPAIPPKPPLTNGQPSQRESFAQPLPTPAFPPQSAAPILPPSQQPLAAPSLPYPFPASTPTHFQQEEDGILVSVTLLRPSSSASPGELVPLGKKDAVRPLEPFVLQVFVFNGTPVQRRFVLGVPEKRRRRFPLEPLAAGREESEGWIGACGLGSAALRARLAEYSSSATPLVPLENAIRFGPLAPRASQAVRMRFMALIEGVHQIDTLGLVGVGDGFAVNLKSVCSVIVKR